MEIRIYQINPDLDEHHVRFSNLSSTKALSGQEQINSGIYDCVFHGEVDCKGLEELYEKFNLDHPKDFIGRSMSVSDVVELCSAKDNPSEFYFCDSVGFKKVNFNKKDCLTLNQETGEIDYNYLFYNQMQEELNQFENHLKTLPSDEILNHVYECAIKRDIVYSLEGNPMGFQESKALYNSGCTLDVLYTQVNKSVSYMEDIEDVIHIVAFEEERKAKSLSLLQQMANIHRQEKKKEELELER